MDAYRCVFETKANPSGLNESTDGLFRGWNYVLKKADLLQKYSNWKERWERVSMLSILATTQRTV